ncbi:hypothetical protein GCWU000324_00457 [Kingella oralis ATCC 51147]|uniref:Uncharacterized protein n=1 Tax=Kingella oralis ATCC 51147 TaxID=629741 RepID=C4GHW9_9NEIS|nr:hypothetical protein GCWU000324_00457 [Kingella oralis ATCC 51147]
MFLWGKGWDYKLCGDAVKVCKPEFSRQPENGLGHFQAALA